MSTVSLQRCRTYDLEKVLDALRASLAPFGGMKAFVKSGQRVLCKVSMLRGAAPDRAISTHPSIAAAAAILVREAGGEALIGDSCGGASDYGQTQKALEVSGFVEAARIAGATIAHFDTAGLTLKPIPDGVFIKEVNVSKAVLDADVIVNLPKLKTHIETLMTGGVKNLLGCIPGAGKLIVHRTAPSPMDLGEALLDIYSILRPSVTILDGVVGMEGNGPARGNPIPIGVVLASDDAVALDHVAARIIGYDPMQIPTIAPALRRGLGENRSEHIEIVGEKIDAVAPAHFRRVNNFVMRSIPRSVLETLNRRFFWVKPAWVENECSLCDLCVNSCPMTAMRREGDTIIIDELKCTQCFCCFELCPEKGIHLIKSVLARLIG